MEFLRMIKECSTTSFGGEVKPSVSCCKMLCHGKEPYEYEKRYFVGKIKYFLCHVPHALLLDDCAGRISRVNIIPSWLSILIYHLGDEQ
jgi:hypothetical protein